MDIRPLAIGDADELGLVHVAVWREAYAAHMPADYLAALDPEVFAAGWKQRAERPEIEGARTWVARDGDGRIVGFASASPGRDRRWGFVDEGGRQVHEPTKTPEIRLIRRLPDRSAQGRA